MSTITKKYAEAIKVFADLKGKKPLEVYSRMTDKGFEWNSFESKWEREVDKAELPLINLNIKCRNELADDALELIRNALEEYGLNIVRETRPYASKEKDAKNNLIPSKTHSNAYIQILYPDSMDESNDESLDEESEG